MSTLEASCSYLYLLPPAGCLLCHIWSLEMGITDRDLVDSLLQRLATLHSPVALEPTSAPTDIHTICRCRQCSML